MAKNKAMLEFQSQAPLSLLSQEVLYVIEMTFKDRLREARRAVRPKLTQAAVAERIGVTAQAVSGWERGEAKPEHDKLSIVAKLYGVTVDWLLDGREVHEAAAPGEELRSEDVAASIGHEPDIRSEDVAQMIEPEPKRKIPVKGYVLAGGEAHYYAVSNLNDFETIEPTERDTDQTVAVRIVGTSLGKFFQGWHVTYDDVRCPITDDLIGELCVVGLEDERVLVKKVARSRTRGLFDLLSNAEKEEPILGVRIAWAAKVSDVRRG
ncbi:MAG TPA: helix-turn-helix transcriptional regulator [Xanthobacteraceae bacterium]|nr:helix-turn-helix transcriptional regulator [Xanthobacteraceae bacterium]